MLGARTRESVAYPLNTIRVVARSCDQFQGSALSAVGHNQPVAYSEQTSAMNYLS
jgi:hypothetical protein